MQNESNKVYPSKVGWGLLILPVLFLGIGIYHTVSKGLWRDVAIQAGILLFLVLIFYSISYEINERFLIVKTFFWFKAEIPVDSITGIAETSNIISSPAASLDRLEIFYGKLNSIIISPKDKAGFIEHLKSLKPEITVKMKNEK